MRLAAPGLSMFMAFVFLLMLAATHAVAAPSGLALASADCGSGDGGAAVTVTGTGLSVSGVTRVVFGGVDATGVMVSALGGGNCSVVCTTPAHPGGLCDITVVNPDSSSATIPGAYVFVPSTFDTLDEMTLLPCASSTSGGGKVFLLGFPENFDVVLNTGQFSLGNVPITGTRPYKVPGCVPLYSFVAPAHPAGRVGLGMVDQGDLISNCFIYGDTTAPMVLSVAPVKDGATGGATIRIYAGNLPLTGTPQVTFGGVAATNVVVHSDFGGWLTCTAPAHAPGTVDVVVQNPNQQSGSLPGAFTYNAILTTPVPTSVSPNQGLTGGGTAVTISGTGFYQGGAPRVVFGNRDATNVVVPISGNGTILTCVAPSRAAGVVDITVINPGSLSGVLSGAFTYIPPPTPKPDTVTPSQGYVFGGETVTIGGSGFTTLGTTSVTMGGVSATSVSVYDTGGGILAVRCTAPAHAAGVVDVVVTGPANVKGTLSHGYTYLPPPVPTVSSVTPNSGSTLGGGSATIEGTGFIRTGTTRVVFGGVDATNVNVSDPGSGILHVDCTVPAHSFTVGPVSVSVINPDGQTGTLGSAYTYLLAPGPYVTSVSPNQGYTIGGTAVTLSGTGFTLTGTTRVTFGTVAATGVQVNDVGGGILNISCCAPVHAAGSVDVTVSNPDGQMGIYVNGFSYSTGPTPVPSSISPNSGSTAGGTSVSISGTGFWQMGTTRVNFGGLDATDVQVVGTTGENLRIACVTPAHAAGSVAVKVYNSNGMSGTKSAGFTYVVPPSPNPTSVSPSSGGVSGGDTVVITGTHFSLTGTTRVTFGGIDATGVSVADVGDGYFQIHCTTPAHVAGTVGVTVINPDGGSGTCTSGFIYVAPVIPASVAPNHGYTVGDETVTVYGTGFLTYGTYVSFGGVLGTVNSVNVSEGSLQCTTPAHVAGVVDVTVSNSYNRSGTLAGAFTYVLPPTPSPTSVSPRQGYTTGGQLVTIQGTGFSLIGSTVVSFGGAFAADVQVIDGGNGKLVVQCLTPAHTAGTVDVVVRGPGGPNGRVVSGFTYNVPPPPAPTSLSPNQGLSTGGYSALIYGSGFLSSGTTRVTFGGTDASEVQAHASDTGTPYISCTVPVHAAGSVDVVVINPDGQTGTLLNGFTYTPVSAPQPTSVSPGTGPATGYTAVTLNGTNFSPVGTTRVTFGGVDATDVQTPVSNSKITCRTPMHAAGTVDIVVINATGERGALANGFVYTAAPPPNPATITPNSGLSTGGALVTINGTGFTQSGKTRVLFGGADAENVQVLDGGYGGLYITCSAPAHAAGLVDVMVINLDGQSATRSNWFVYAAAPPPNPTSVYRQGGTTMGGSRVTIGGTGFGPCGPVSVTFDGVQATEVQVVNSSTITCRTPAHAEGGAVVTVTNGDGQSGTLPAPFLYLSPFIMDMDPHFAPATGGSVVTISGYGFALSGSRVLFGDADATGVVATDDTINCISPPHAPGNVDVTIVNPDGLSYTRSGLFTYGPSGDTVIRVDADNHSGIEDGATWATAFTTIQAGITASIASGRMGEIWVADGTYTADIPGTVVVAMQPYVDVYGGFAGVETRRDQRDFRTHSCFIDGLETSACIYGADMARLDGFTVTGGNGPLRLDTSSYWLNIVAGSLAGGDTTADISHMVAVDNSGVYLCCLANCSFTGNDTWFAVLANLTDSDRECSPVVTGCTFTGNTGGCAAVINGAANGLKSNARIDRCTFTDNSYGIMDVSWEGVCTPTITGCQFVSNKTALEEVGVFSGTCASHVENCEFSQHTPNTLYFTGLPNTLQITPTFSNCTFARNTAAKGLFYASGGTVRADLRNCIIWGNAGPLQGGGSGLITLTASHCDIQGGFPGVGNIDAAPLFNGQTCKIRGESPCIDAGAAVAAPATDLRGVTRPQFGGVDMGAYECTVRAAFSADHQGISAPGSEVRFTDTSVSKRSALNAWSWNFGDSATSALHNPKHSYVVRGSYTVVLDVAGPDDAASCKGTYLVADWTPLRIVQQPRDCTAKFGTPYTLSVQAQGGVGLIHYLWKKDGKPLTESGEYPTYTIDSLTSEDAGYYVCEVSDDYDTLDSYPARILDPTGLPAAGWGVMVLLAVLLALASIRMLRHSL